ncbi:MAG: CBS domain-containing protein [Myxococcales bacterium]|nr:CBS domain-containing protein [Myxococcales bacterium]
MGDPNVFDALDEERVARFTATLLGDLRALERLLSTDVVERGVTRIGAEQELFLVDDRGRAAPVGPQILSRCADPRLTPEIARFNLEANLSPRPLAGGSLGALHAELREVVDVARAHAASVGARVVLVGILPTLERADLEPTNFSPGTRYTLLDDATRRARGGSDAPVHIEGVDELALSCSSVMLEACNTSFQLHLQVDPERFAALYNVAQWASAPLLAAAAGSPLLFDRRLWRETRIALFRQSVDGRSEAHRARGAPARVSFGESWVRDSVLERFREDVSRHRVLVTNDAPDDAEARLDAGEVPMLRALRLHAGTVWRWNRGCYGVHVDEAGRTRAHLRIENRVLPAGPSLMDEVANAALFYGLMIGAHETWGDPAARMPFEAVREGFLAVARTGLGSELALPDGRRGGAQEMLREHLVPLAREGLRHAGVDAAEADAYLDVIDARVGKRRTLASWLLEGHRAFGGARAPARSERLVAALATAQANDRPIHEWPDCADVEVTIAPRAAPRVRDIMSSDLFTLRVEDAVDLAASVMGWRHVRHVPVEDGEGRLCGMITHRDLFELLGRHDRPRTVREVMQPAPPTVGPDEPAELALARLLERGVSALAVVDGERLVGIVTERDLLELTAQVLGR